MRFDTVHGILVYDPLFARLVVVQIDFVTVGEVEVNEIAFVGPGAKREWAVLSIEWKKLQIDGTRATKERSWNPEHCAVRVNDE